MFETPIVIVGTVITDPVLRSAGEQSVYRFRVASNSRRRSSEGTWEQGNTLYASVSCWGKLAQGTAGSLRKGDPVIVVGEVYTSEYDDRDGNPRSSVEVRARAVGPDLARSVARIEKIQRRTDEQAGEPSGTTSVDEAVIDGIEPAGADLPLTA